MLSKCGMDSSTQQKTPVIWHRSGKSWEFHSFSMFSCFAHGICDGVKSYSVTSFHLMPTLEEMRQRHVASKRLVDFSSTQCMAYVFITKWHHLNLDGHHVFDHSLYDTSISWSEQSGIIIPVVDHWWRYYRWSICNYRLLIMHFWGFIITVMCLSLQLPLSLFHDD